MTIYQWFINKGLSSWLWTKENTEISRLKWVIDIGGHQKALQYESLWAFLSGTVISVCQQTAFSLPHLKKQICLKIMRVLVVFFSKHRACSLLVVLLLFSTFSIC